MAKDKLELSEILKSIYKAESIGNLKNLIQSFGKMRKKLQGRKEILDKYYSILNFYHFPREMGRSIYTNNLVETSIKG